MGVCYHSGMVTPDTIPQNPFAVLSLIAAPALLTNASSVLALSTSNRFLRASDRMRVLAGRLETESKSSDMAAMLGVQVDRVEKQAFLLLTALKFVYVSLGCFAGASLISIFGAALGATSYRAAFDVTVVLAMVVGFVGISSLVYSCYNLFRATRISMLNISEEAALIRARRADRLSRTTSGE